MIDLARAIFLRLSAVGHDRFNSVHENPIVLVDRHGWIAMLGATAGSSSSAKRIPGFHCWASQTVAPYARAIGRGIATIVAKLQLTVHACAILPEHVHAVVAVHRLDSDAIMEALEHVRNPCSVTAAGGSRWLRAINHWLPPATSTKTLRQIQTCSKKRRTPEDMCRAIRYVEQNPLRAGFKVQRWSYVVPYESVD